MKTQKCIACGRETVSVIKTEEGHICYNCYSDKRTLQNKSNTMITKKLGFSRSFSIRFLYSFLICRIDFIFAVPNGGSRHKIEAANMKRQGVKRGVADVILQIPKKGYASLCLEFKTSTGKQSAEQKEYQRQVEMAGSKYVIVRSVEQAIRELQLYLG